VAATWALTEAWLSDAERMGFHEFLSSMVAEIMERNFLKSSVTCAISCLMPDTGTAIMCHLRSK